MATTRTRVRRRSKPPFDVKRLRRTAIRPPKHDVRPDAFIERKTVLALPADADGPPSVKTWLTKRGRGAAARWEVELVVDGRELHPVPPPSLQTRLIPTRRLARVAIDAMPASIPATDVAKVAVRPRARRVPKRLHMSSANCVTTRPPSSRPTGVAPTTTRPIRGGASFASSRRAVGRAAACSSGRAMC
jgi:hypothetical protein